MLVQQKHIALICNPTSENEKALGVTDRISILLRGMDIRHSIFTTYWPQNWSDITEAWVIGGDGTLNYFINQYKDIQMPLSVFAGGTGNDFHWMLYGDIGVEEQVEKVLESTIHSVDAGICNDQLFLNGVGIGFDGAIVKDLLGKKKQAGKGSYLLSVLKHIIGYREKTYEIQTEGNIIKQNCFMVTVANARRYGGGFKVAPKAAVDDGLLDLNIIGEISPLKRMRYLPVIEKGEHTELPFINYFQTAAVAIESNTVLPAHLDGEFIEANIFNIQVLPNRFSFLW